MSETRWKSLLNLLKFKRKPSSSTSPEQQTSDISAGLGLSKELEPLDGGTTGSLTIHSRTDPNLTLRRGLGGKASAPQPADDTSRNVGGVESRNALPERRHTNASVKEGPSARPLVPYALTWTEHKLELRPVRPLKRSDEAGMTPDVFPRFGHSCTAIPNSSGEFIIFGGKIPSGKEEISTNDVVLMSTSNMSLTSLETNGAKPKPKAGHRAVIAGRVLVVFGGNADDSSLNFLNLDTREWSNLRPPAPYPSPRFGHSLIVVNHAIWIYGGFLDKVQLDDMWCIDLKTERIEHARWRQVPKRSPWPEARSYHSTVYHHGCLYLFGGSDASSSNARAYLNDLWKFDIRTETWSSVQCHGQLPQGRDSHVAAVIEDNMFVFGGLTQGRKEGKNVRTDHAFVFNFGDRTWRSLAMLGHNPSPTTRGVLLALDSQLVLVGGQNGREQHIHVADAGEAGSTPDSLARLQFTTETTKLEFTTEIVDLSRFVRKQGNSAHSMAGFSDVWKGVMTETGQPIAIKVLRVTNTRSLDNSESGRLRTRFDRELTIWMECQHPRVLELLGYAYIEGVPCLISPWCSNGNIMEYISKNLDANRRQLINQVAEGLVYLHGREPSVIHSDIKPANVLVSDGGDAKLCDFGISKFVLEYPSGFTTTASVKGTLRYSSPEMLDSDGKSTTASDVWAFGMLILHVMTNKLPYAELLSDAKVIMAIIGGQRPSPANYPELPSTDPLWDVMEECWCENPMKRPTMTGVFSKLPRLVT